MAVEEINTKRCRMWHMHDRLGEYIDENTCASLIESIRRDGQKLPALGRRIPRIDGFDIELIYGSRRLFSAQRLHRKILVDVREINDQKALVEMDIENRVRLDISAYERGLGYRRWLTAGLFVSQADLAKALGVSEAHVSRLLKYAAIPAAVIEAFDSPRDIREEWAIVLARQCQDPALRTPLLQRARRRSRSGRAQTPRSIYSSLIGDSLKGLDRPNARDEIVKDMNGVPLLRICYRAKTVLLVLPRENVTAESLREIARQLKKTLERSRSDKSSGLQLVIESDSAESHDADVRPMKVDHSGTLGKLERQWDSHNPAASHATADAQV